jgi:hypothetical protein
VAPAIPATLRQNRVDRYLSPQLHWVFFFRQAEKISQKFIIFIDKLVIIVNN